MKKHAFLLALLFWAAQAHAGWVKISGKIENPLEATVELVRITSHVSGQEKVYTAKLDANGEFSVDMEVFMPEFIQIRHSKYFKTSAFAAPDQDFRITFDCVEFPKSVSYSGKGGNDNNFLAQYFMKYESNTAWDHYLLMCKSHDPEAFTANWKEHQAEELAFLEEFHAKSPLSDKFKPWAADHIRYKNANQLWDYQFNHAWENGIEVVDFKVPASYFLFFDELKSSNDYLQSSPYYNRFLANYIWHLYSLDLEARGMEGFERYDIRMRKEASLVKKNLTGYARDKQYSSIMFDILEKNEKDVFEEMYADYKAQVADEHMKFIIETRAGTVEAKHRGEVMPQGAKEVTVVDADGNTVPFRDILSVYAGKVVYIDIWASWCAPCIQEMPSSLMLQEHFAGKDVVFLYLSQDEEEERWRQAISKHDIKGEHILMNRELFLILSGEYNISQIPRYMVVDKRGNMVNSDATTPSSPRTVELIESLLGQ
jgi:thiol-disulfide isomerase/thioredoxin